MSKLRYDCACTVSFYCPSPIGFSYGRGACELKPRALPVLCRLSGCTDRRSMLVGPELEPELLKPNRRRSAAAGLVAPPCWTLFPLPSLVQVISPSSVFSQSNPLLFPSIPPFSTNFVSSESSPRTGEQERYLSLSSFDSTAFFVHLRSIIYQPGTSSPLDAVTVVDTISFPPLGV